MAIQTKKTYATITDAQKRGMQSQRDLGYTLKEIAETFNVSDSAVGVHTRPTAKISRQRIKKKAQDLINAGISRSSVATECCKTQRWVRDNTLVKRVDPKHVPKPLFERRSSVLVSGGAVKVGQVGVVENYLPPRGEVTAPYALVKFKGAIEEWILCDWLVEA